MLSLSVVQAAMNIKHRPAPNVHDGNRVIGNISHIKCFASYAQVNCKNIKEMFISMLVFIIGYIEHSSSLWALEIFTRILILGVIVVYMVRFWVIANNFRAFRNIVLSVPLNPFANALDNATEIILQWFVHPQVWNINNRASNCEAKCQMPSNILKYGIFLSPWTINMLRVLKYIW